jgi:hypothetical protein
LPQFQLEVQSICIEQSVFFGFGDFFGLIPIGGKESQKEFFEGEDSESIY